MDKTEIRLKCLELSRRTAAADSSTVHIERARVLEEYVTESVKKEIVSPKRRGRPKKETDPMT